MVSLPSSGLGMGMNLLQSRSFDAQSFLEKSGCPYSSIFFPSRNGIGYYSFVSHHQGLLCTSSKLILALDDLPLALKIKLSRDEKADKVVTDLEALKEEYMIQRSIELAVSCNY
jgi:hypothetical protein